MEDENESSIDHKFRAHEDELTTVQTSLRSQTSRDQADSPLTSGTEDTKPEQSSGVSRDLTVNMMFAFVDIGQMYTPVTCSSQLWTNGSGVQSIINAAAL